MATLLLIVLGGCGSDSATPSPPAVEDTSGEVVLQDLERAEQELEDLGADEQEQADVEAEEQEQADIDAAAENDFDEDLGLDPTPEKLDGTSS